MKVLIIKTGITETFDHSSLHQNVVSLGDVLRTTVILHLFKADQVSWLTSPEAFFLLNGIENLAVHKSSSEIDPANFDLIVNLERSSEMLNLTASSPNVISAQLQTDQSQLNWSEKLFLLFGKKWNGENYIISRKYLDTSKSNTFEVGLNWKVGVKWPSKSWPFENWKSLEARISSSLSITWQEGFDDLIQYMNWVNSSQVLVTHDSLGLHIAQALNKKILGLFGPTSSHEIHLGDGVALSVSERPSFSCPPCYKDSCHNMIHCMKSLSVDDVENSLRILLRGLDGKSAIRWKQTSSSSG